MLCIHSHSLLYFFFRMSCVPFSTKALSGAIRKMFAGPDQPDPCPLITGLTLHGSKWKLSDLLKLEWHIATQTTCQHPKLKNWVLSEPLQGSTPLLMACAKGNLKSVKRIVVCGEVANQCQCNWCPLYLHRYIGQMDANNL